MIIPKSMEGRYCAFLLQGISTQELKVSHVLPEEIVGIYATGDEVHISPAHIVAWWPDVTRENKHKGALEAARKRKASKQAESLLDEGEESDDTITQSSREDRAFVKSPSVQVKRKG